jgi:pyruvate,water dikinase
MVFVAFPEDKPPLAEAGGKARALSRLQGSGLEIPAWFVIKPVAFHESLSEAQRAAFEHDPADIDALGAVTPAASVTAEVRAALARICPQGEPVAVRSSAVEEDSAHASFAGQLESFLRVPHEEVARRIADVWRSGFSARVVEYRRQIGLTGEPQAPAVLVQRMIPADVSGIAFSADPVSGNRALCVVASTRGLGDKLVAGEVEGDVYHVSEDGIVTIKSETGEAANLPEAMVQAVARLARATEQHFGRPQDIEWAAETDRLYLLQARPITTLAAEPDETGGTILWDNSNIVESYSGVTAPLTFSFARGVYEAVYREFLGNLGVSREVIDANAQVFRNMLGLIEGRVYYNLLNWYRMLTLLPGFAANKRYLDLMLGVDQALRAELATLVEEPSAESRSQPFAAVRLLRPALGILVNWLVLPLKIKRFQDRLDAALVPPPKSVADMRLDELAVYYRGIEGNLLVHWDAPVLNDFFCMIFFGLSRQALRRWGGSDGEALHGDLLQRQGDIISTEPAQRIAEMAMIVADDARLSAALVSGDPEECSRMIQDNPAFRKKYDDYLDRFGDRCLQELKLESPTLRDDPRSLLQTIGDFAANPRTDRDVREATDPNMALGRLLRRTPLRLVIARWLVRQARRRIRHRENLRFERTRVFGLARRIFLEIGRRFKAVSVLDDERDVFYLEVGELLGFIEGTATMRDLRALAKLRKAEFDRFRRLPDPPSRFETRGAVAVATPQAAFEDLDFDASTEERRGLGCCPGLVRGPVRLIEEPKGQKVEPGQILVAKHTDPGWVFLFTNAAGLIVERGSLLSHSAIVAREMGIPAVVSVAGLTRWLADGDEVELDGATGIVRRLNHG